MVTINAVGVGLSGQTGTGTFVGSTSPTLVTPALGTPSSGNLANCTGYPSASLSGNVPLSLGGTSASLTASNGGIFYSTGSAGAILSGTATANQVLMSGASTTPAWSSAVFPATTTINQILYSSSTNVIQGLATANNGVLITSATGVPSLLAAGTTGQVLTATTGSPPSWASPATSSISITGDTGGALTGSAFTFTGGSTGLTFAGSGSTETLGGTLTLANGGTNASLTASNGGIFYSTATAGAILAGTATAGQIIRSGASTAPTWSTATWPATTTANEILYSSSANTVSQITTAANGVLITSNASVPSFLGNSATAGYVLTANSGAPPSWQAPLISTYTQGTFTPGLAFGGSSTGITYGLQLGEYTQIGNIVTFTLHLIVSSVGTATGNASLTGLPVAQGPTSAINFFPIPSLLGITLPTGSYSVFAGGVASTTTFNLYYNNPLTGDAFLTNSAFTTSAAFAMSGSYLII